MTACVREKVLTLSSVDTGSFCKGEEMFLLGVKEAAAIVSLLILIVVLIAKLRECPEIPALVAKWGMVVTTPAVTLEPEAKSVSSFRILIMTTLFKSQIQFEYLELLHASPAK